MNFRKLILVTAIFFATAPLSAGGFGIHGSFWNTDALEDTVGAGIKWTFGDEVIRFDLRGSFFPDLSNDISNTGDDPQDVDVEAIVPEAGITFNFSPGHRFQPYIGAGLSYYLLELDDVGAQDTDVDLDDEVGFYGLAGFETGGDTAFFAEALYRSVEGTVTDGNNIVSDVELDLSGLSINAGVIFRF